MAVDGPTLRQPLKDVLKASGLTLDKGTRYIYVPPTSVPDRESRGYEVLIEGVRGAAGESFTLMGRTEGASGDPTEEVADASL